MTARPGEADTAFQLAGVAAAARAVRALLPSDPPAVEITERVTEEWLADDRRALGNRAAAVAVLEGPADVGFAAVRDGRTVVAKGRVALSDGPDPWLGITDVWVSSTHRRQGLASVVLQAMLRWGAERGSATAYLQVREDNTPGVALYARLGFVSHHSYRYLRPG